MGIWKLLTQVWPWGRSNRERHYAARREPGTRSLNRPDMFEPRTARSIIYEAVDEPDFVHAAEVLYVSVGQQHRQFSLTQSRFLRLSVVIVDYLLEHEWYWLLTGQHPPYARSHAEMRALTHQQDRVMSASEAFEERCTSAGGPPWSVIATIPPDHLPGT